MAEEVRVHKGYRGGRGHGRNTKEGRVEKPEKEQWGYNHGKPEKKQRGKSKGG